MEAEAAAVDGGWGTWEELVLGGAVLRHGTEDWNVVASELRARTLYPCAFTPQACKERYEDLQNRYSGSTEWFNELRKQRVAELKRVLAKSEESIGSLESKIKSLTKPEKVHSSPAGYGLNGNQSQNNESSVGSFTKDTMAISKPATSWPCHKHITTSTSLSSDNGLEKHLWAKSLAGPGYRPVVVLKKRRGQRSRRGSNRAAEERSVGESDNLGCTNAVLITNAEEFSVSGPGRREAMRESGSDGELNEGSDRLIEIFRCIAESDPAAAFRHRLDSQKRARYRKLIKQHMDIATIKSRIIEKGIKSGKELFHDLLLIVNNALVFYSRPSAEYKSAVSLRELVMQEYKKHCMGSHGGGPMSGFIPCNPPMKPRTARPRPEARSRAHPC